jgi:hypothetical protein
MGRMSSQLILIQPWTYKLQIKKKDVYIGKISAQYTRQNLDNASWQCIILGDLELWPSNMVHVHDLCLKSQFMFFENSSKHREVIALFGYTHM